MAETRKLKTIVILSESFVSFGKVGKVSQHSRGRTLQALGLTSKRVLTLFGFFEKRVGRWRQVERVVSGLVLSGVKFPISAPWWGRVTSLIPTTRWDRGEII